MQILDRTHEQFKAAFRQRYGKGPQYSTPVYRQVMKSGKVDVNGLAPLGQMPDLARRVARDLALPVGHPVKKIAGGNAMKFLTRLRDGRSVESVVICMHRRYTLCVSSQVGCRMGCRFCKTGKMGLVRNLTASEIVVQLFIARFQLGFPIRNVVFMGMGEPLDNLDPVIQAIRVMEDQRGLDIARRYITVSTAGLIEGIRRLAEIDGRSVNLAVSLNAPSDALRSRLMPVNRSCSLVPLQRALQRYPLSKKAALWIEYVLIRGVNDQFEHARALATYLAPLNAKVNLIPFNPVPGSGLSPPSTAGFERFHAWLKDQRLFVRRRSEKGRCIMAACGQLGEAQGQPAERQL